MTKASWWLVFVAISGMLTAPLGAQPADDPPTKNMAWELRKLTLSLKPRARNGAAIVMDVNVDGTVMSVMSSTDGAASVYLSSGGAMIGGEAHAHIRSHAIAFATEAARHQREMQAVTDFPYPAAGNVRFYVHTRDGIFFAEASKSELTDGALPLSALFKLGEKVFIDMKAITPRKRK
jgi:hypothetical protein